MVITSLTNQEVKYLDKLKQRIIVENLRAFVFIVQDMTLFKTMYYLIEKDNIQVKINGSGWVKSQSPEPGTPVTENMVIELNLE